MKTVAVIGASNDRAKFGNKALRAFRHRGYRAVPINPHAATVEGERAYANVREFPGTFDVATIYVPPEVALGVLDDLQAQGIKKVWLNPGADDPGVVGRARSLGLEPMVACSIRAIGESPSDY